MACIWMDGFEIDFPNSTAGIWDSIAISNANSYYETGVGVRTGNGCWRFTGTATDHYHYLQRDLGTSLTEVYFGFSIRITGTPQTNSGSYAPIFTLLEGATSVCSLGINETTAYLAVMRGSANGTLLGDIGTALIPDVTHYVEVRIVVSATVGIVQLRLNGNLLIDLNNQNTAGSAAIDRIRLGPNFGFQGTVYFDDFIINDTTGTVSNSWPDGVGIELLNPNGDGTYSDWTSTGVNDYTEIDEYNIYGSLDDGDTTTLTSSVTNQRVSVNVDNPTLTGNVQAIMLLAQAKNDGAGLDEMAQFVRVAGADYDQTSFAPTVGYSFRHDILTLNPATAAQWLIAELNAIEYGVLRVT